MFERQLLDLVAAVHGILDLDELREAVLDAVPRLVPADWISLNDIGPEPVDAVFLARPPVEPTLLATFGSLAHQQPLLGFWRRTRDGRAYRFSDVINQTDFEALPVFREFYARLGIRHQIAFTLPSESDRVLAVALSRAQHDFSDGERDLLNAARPFLIQAYRTALEYTRLREWVQPSAGTMPALHRALSALGLTEREIEVARWAATGRSNVQVAERLGISARTVQKHLERAYRKLGVAQRAELTARLRELQAAPA